MKPIKNQHEVTFFLATAAKRHLDKASDSVVSRYTAALVDEVYRRDDCFTDNGRTLTFKATERLALEAELVARNVKEFGTLPRLTKNRPVFPAALEAAIRPVVVGTPKSDLRWRWIRLSEDVAALQAAAPKALVSVRDYVEEGEIDFPSHSAFLALETKDGKHVGSLILSYMDRVESWFDPEVVSPERFAKAEEAAVAFVGPRLILDCYPTAVFDGRPYLSEEGFVLEFDAAGYLHCEDGPALISPDGGAEWWLHGKQQPDPRPENLRGVPWDEDGEPQPPKARALSYGEAEGLKFDPDYDDGANPYDC